MSTQKPKAQSKNTRPAQSSATEIRGAIFARVSQMSPREGFRSLISSGIYTAEGNLSKRYGG
jgi:hypothetical protein